MNKREADAYENDQVLENPMGFHNKIKDAKESGYCPWRKPDRLGNYSTPCSDPTGDCSSCRYAQDNDY